MRKTKILFAKMESFIIFARRKNKKYNGNNKK